MQKLHNVMENLVSFKKYKNFIRITQKITLIIRIKYITYLPAVLMLLELLVL